MSTRSTSLRTLAAGVVAAALLGGCALTDGPAGGVTPTTAPTPEPSAHDEAAATADDADTGTPTDGPTTEEPTAPTADDGTTSPTGTAADGTGEDDGSDGGAGTTGTAGVVDPATVDLAELTVGWPCGHGFELSHPDGTATLVLEWVRPGTRQPQAMVAFPDRRWEGRLYLGEGLGAVSCSPGTEPPGVVETWEVVAGVIRFGDPGGSLEGQVTAELNGITVAAPDGTKLELPNQTVVNQGWGVTYDR